MLVCVYVCKYMSWFMLPQPFFSIFSTCVCIYISKYSLAMLGFMRFGYYPKRVFNKRSSTFANTYRYKWGLFLRHSRLTFLFESNVKRN